MYSPVISETDYEQSRYEKEHGSHAKIRNRMHMIYLRYQGYSPGECARILGVHPNTITNWTKLYIAEGLPGLRQLSYRTPQSELVQYQSEISESFSQQAPHTVSEAAA
ncbi:MAG: helix-turn-helix domain-containing protein, partial [Bacteroidota bacterium]